MKPLKTICVATGIVYTMLGLQLVSNAQAGTPAGKERFKQLVEGARKEGRMTLFITTSGSDEVVRAFKVYLKRLGVDLDLRVDGTGFSAQKASQAIGETKQGVVPTYDVQFGAPHELTHLLDVQGIKRIENVDELLSEIAPQALPPFDRISPNPFKNRAFTFGHYIKANVYNTRLISAAELPRTRKELGEARYKGAFGIPPWTTDPEASLLVYDKDEALEIIRAIGRNKGGVERESAAVNRMLLGEFKFVNANAHYYYEFKAKDPRAPIGVEFFRDYTIVGEAMYFVREGAPHPNAATLFVLWTLSKEGQEAYEEATKQPNLYLPSSKIGREILGLFRERNVKVVSWMDSEESIKKLRWLAQTEEGRAWTNAVAKAWQQGR